MMDTFTHTTPTTSESNIRAKAKRPGYRVEKSRERTIHSNNQGAFQLINERNYVVLGDRYDASLAEIDAFLRGVEVAR